MWRLGGFGLILDAEYGCCKKISAVYGFCIATIAENSNVNKRFTVFRLLRRTFYLITVISYQVFA